MSKTINLKFKEFTNNPEELFDFSMSRLIDGMYDTAMNHSVDGKFKAVCLSGIDGSNNSALVTDKYMNIIVRPIGPIGEMLPDPRIFNTPDEVNKVINLHYSAFLAKSDFEYKDHEPILFGQVVNCYYEKGSITRSDFTGLRFQKPKAMLLDESYVKLSNVEGVQSGPAAFYPGLSNPMLMNSFNGTINPGQGSQLGPSEYSYPIFPEDNIFKKLGNQLDPAMGARGGVGIDAQELQRVAEAQIRWWANGNRKFRGAARNPGTEEYNKVMNEYWPKAPGIRPTPSTPWSAATISYIMITAGISSFGSGTSHYKYTKKVREGKSPGWKAFSLVRGASHVDVGDVLVKPRGNGSKAQNFFSHGDTVYKIENQEAFLVGGNLGASVQIAGRIKLDQNGLATGVGKYTVILKKVS